MKTQLARNLLLVVNTPDTLSALQEYVAERVLVLHKQLETLSDITEIYKTQGMIRELKRFDTLREEVIEASRGNK